MTSVLFYIDAAEFGGHEAMTLLAIRCLSQRDDLAISVAFYEGNVQLGVGLTNIANETRNLTLLPLKFKSKSLQAFRSLISFRKVEYLKRLINKVNPSVVIVAQGRIEGGSMGLLAAKRAGFRTVSYLPMAHPLSVSGKPVALWLRKLVNGYFYRLPDQFLTISESARSMLLEQGARNVLVVPNGIDVRPVARSDRERFRQHHNIRKEEYLVGVIGRIDFRQKGQDFALEAISTFRNHLDTYRFVFIGEGPDTQELKAMIAQTNLSQRVQVLPWCSDPERAYAGLDMLLIPSKFEGVPLVMLEAMAYKLPIVASNTDAMAEFLPQCWLFPFGDHHALVDRLIQVRQTDSSPLLESHRKQVTEQFTTDRFRINMTAAILGQTAAALSVCGGR